MPVTSSPTPQWKYPTFPFYLHAETHGTSASSWHGEGVNCHEEIKKSESEEQKEGNERFRSAGEEKSTIRQGNFGSKRQQRQRTWSNAIKVNAPTLK